METNQFARQIFQEYKAKVQASVGNYNFLKTKFPDSQFPTQARIIGKLSVLAEAWGAIAKKIDGVDYIEQWREGK